MSDGQLLQFADEKNAKQLWKAIHDRYAGPAEDRAIDAGEELKNIKMLDKETTSEYISRVRGLATKCASAGLNITERQIVYHTVRGLHNKFTQIKEILKTQREKRLDEIFEVLREKEREMQKGNNGANGQEAAYASKNYQKFKKNNKKKCFVCGKLGHVAKVCYHRKDKGRQEGSDHEKKKENNTGNTSKNANFASDDKVDYATFQAYNVSTCPRLTQNDWIIDSGCTSHMTFDKRFFVNYKPIKGKVYLASKRNILESKGIGTNKVMVDDNKGKTIHVTMDDVIYVPNLRSNLLSVTKLIQRGLIVNFMDNEVKICKENNEIITTGKRLDNHFVLHMTPIIAGNKIECNSVSVNDTSSNNVTSEKFSGDMANMWHRRLGHVNNKYIQRLVKERLADGINKEIGDINCEACKVCKLSRKPHKSVKYEQSDEILDLLHMDICGPMPIESIGGSRYILLIIDDYSGMYFTYFLKNKSDTFSIFQVFNEKCKNIMKKRVKRIRTDNGTEFVNNQFQVYLDKEGIEHQKTVPYNPESNGKVERGN